ncbi:MAG: HlyD family type I secretion periplasmic adaptor subunit [Chromatiales bacterium]|nr:HlyD family type I secretion periplasmic adaptor subunit [Chromatiales bacterium]
MTEQETSAEEKQQPAPVNIQRGGPKGGDVEFMNDRTAAVLLETPRGGRMIVWMVLLFLLLSVLWANWAELDEVTKGAGKVIPSSQIQIIQNLEGGILSSLLVKEGDAVEKDQVLLQIDDTRFSSSLRETKLQYWALKAKAARLQAEAGNTALQAPEDVLAEHPELIRREHELFNSQSKQLATNRAILLEQSQQMRQDIAELKAKRSQLQRSLTLVKKELELSQPLVDAGAISEVEMLRLRKEINEIRGELESTTLALPRAQSRLDEAEKKVSEIEIRFRSEARAELNEVRAELSKLEETSVALEDRVKRTAVRSPVKGTVKQLMVNTLGGVIQPGMELMEIVPLEDSLLIEARVGPKDIAFLHPGQKAIVKLTAYDFAIYGALEGKVEHISADTIKDEREDESYYLVRVRTEMNFLGTPESQLPIIPGMQAEVDILTGKKTVLEYILKPVLRAKGRALRER